MPYGNFVRSYCRTGERRCFQTDKLGLILYMRVVMVVALRESALPHRTSSTVFAPRHGTTQRSVVL